MVKLVNMLILQWLFIKLVVYKKEDFGFDGIGIQGFRTPITQSPLGRTWNMGWGWNR